jgi:hypothetical protein
MHADTSVTFFHCRFFAFLVRQIRLFSSKLHHLLRLNIAVNIWTVSRNCGTEPRFGSDRCSRVASREALSISPACRFPTFLSRYRSPAVQDGGSAEEQQSMLRMYQPARFWVWFSRLLAAQGWGLLESAVGAEVIYGTFLAFF